jgi:hypothetical protein
MDALVARQMVLGESPHVPVSELGGTLDVAAFRTPIAIALSVPFVWFTDTQLVPMAAVFVALTGALFLRVLNRPWWWGALIVVWPFSEVDRHGKATFLVGALLIGAALLRPKWAGLCLALAVGLRLWPAVVAVGFLMSGRWRTAVWSAGWFAGLSTLIVATTTVSVEGTVTALSQDVGYVDGFNLAPLRNAPSYVLPVGVVLFAWWAWGKDWRRAFRWSVPVGLLLSPLVYAASLPVLAVAIGKAPRFSRRKTEGPREDLPRMYSQERLSPHDPG